MSAGNLNVPVDFNILGNINMSSSSFLTINNKWFIFSASANGVANSFISITLIRVLKVIGGLVEHRPTHRLMYQMTT